MDRKQDNSDALPPYGVHAVRAVHLAAPGAAPVIEETRVVEEDALTLDIAGVGTYTLMWTPTEDLGEATGFTREEGVLTDTHEPEALALAAGFAFTEGLIAGLDDIKTMALCPDTPGVVRIELHAPEQVKTRRRNVVMTSSCGICGSREVLDSNIFGLEPVPDTLRLDARGFAALMEAMRERQAVFMETGGAHAAAIFGADGGILASAEDLGRHNALDKVIGKALLSGLPLAGHGVVLSSRLSLEMVTKAVRAGLEIVAAVSAPTSLAIAVADKFGVTLCGFVRGQRATVYAHPHRIREIPAEVCAAAR